MRADFADDFDAIGFAERGRKRMRHQVQGRFVHRAALDRIERAGIGIAVFFQPALEQDHSVDLPPDGGPSSSSKRRPTSEPAAAALK